MAREKHKFKTNGNKNFKKGNEEQIEILAPIGCQEIKIKWEKYVNRSEKKTKNVDCSKVMFKVFLLHLRFLLGYLQTL